MWRSCANGIAPIAYSSLAPLSTWRIEPGQDSGKTDAMKADDGVFLRMASKYGVTEAAAPAAPPEGTAMNALGED